MRDGKHQVQPMQEVIQPPTQTSHGQVVRSSHGLICPRDQSLAHVLHGRRQGLDALRQPARTGCGGGACGESVVMPRLIILTTGDEAENDGHEEGQENGHVLNGPHQRQRAC
ncbi:hypothetical protein FA95DRAFT_1548690 [Auriscalpium vulgare]|uniref:Uncharacterized protein n=1 Tax=Auriscalpium vulgare TaxID=40419 RepID=A0ACB8RBS3_9AGAM|nr:hypothetical protein FA95DRAFT_1548690 [Auriscalpium vulgare]